MPSPDELRSDQAFMSASPQEQHAYLTQSDPDYAKAAPADQQGYLKHIMSTYAPPVSRPPQPKMAVRTLWGYGEPYHPMPGAGEGANLAEGLADWEKSTLPIMYRGAKDISKGNIAKGSHQVISGGMNTLAPLAGFAGPGTLARIGIGGYLGGKAARGITSLATQNPDVQDVAEDVGNIAGGITGSRVPSMRGLGEWARGDPNAAITEALHVGAKSPKMQAKLADVEGARPYLKGATSQAEVQQRLPGAKAEVWDNYAKAVNMVKDQPVTGPDGPTTVGELEAARLKNSADLQTARKVAPTDQQTALQKEESLARLMERDQQIKAALDPILQKTGIDPAAIREVHGHLKGVERSVSGKSTVAEQMRPYGAGRMIPRKLPLPGTNDTAWQWQPIQGLKDIVAGRPLIRGKPTDVAMKDLFSRGGPKPNFGTPTAPRIAGLLSRGDIEAPASMEPIGEPSAPPPVEATTRAQRLGLLLPERAGGRIPLPPVQTPPEFLPPIPDYTTRAQRLGLQLPEPRGHAMQEYGYSSPSSPGEVPKMGKFSPGKKVGDIRTINDTRYRWDGEKWSRLER